MADSLVKRFLPPPPVAAGIVTLLLSWLLYFSFGDQKPSLLSAIDARIVDAMFQLRGPEQTSGHVVIVDIDEKSLREYGQWPWPRDIVARLTKNIYAAEPLAVGFDILFAEPDQTSPKTVIRRYPKLFADNDTPALTLLERAEKADHDRLFAETLQEGPGVLGYLAIFTNDGLKQDSAHPHQTVSLSVAPYAGKLSNLPLARPYRALTNIPQLAEASHSEGFFNIFPDSRGTVRQAPLFLNLGDIPSPSLPLEMVRIGQRIDAVTIQLAPSSAHTAPAIAKIQLGSHLLHTDEAGNIAINYRGPTTTFMTTSAADVLAGTEQFLLQEKYILVGSTAAGITDIVATPFSPQTAGVEVHANIIDNLLADDYLVWDNFTETGLTYAITGIFGLLLTLCLAFFSPAAGLISATSLLVLIAAGNYFLLFQRLKLIGLSYSLLTLVVIFFSVTFTNYFTEGRRRQFVRRAFSRYVPPAVVNKLLNNRGDFGKHVESRDVTVVFADIRDFTRLAETMSPEHLGEFLNRYLSRMTSLIIKHHGMVDKFVGDGIMAVWGTPLNDDHHAQNAVAASLAMITEVRKNDTSLNIGRTPMEIGIGINSGPVRAGNFGSNKRFTYTVLGDTVNLASRIEALTKFYGLPLLLSEATVAGLHATISCQRIDTVLVKGRHQPVSLFIPDSLFFNNSGRDQEKEIFNKALHHYMDGEFELGQQLFYNLNIEWSKRIYVIYQKRCLDFSHSPPLQPWRGVWDFN